jgi:hypothetical protein
LTGAVTRHTAPSGRFEERSGILIAGAIHGMNHENHDDLACLAARVIALHPDAALWTRIREAALARVATELDPRDFAACVLDLSRPGKRSGVELVSDTKRHDR